MQLFNRKKVFCFLEQTMKSCWIAFELLWNVYHLLRAFPPKIQFYDFLKLDPTS